MLHLNLLQIEYFNYNRYKTIPELVPRVKEVQHQYCLLSKRHHRLKQKIAQAAERAEVVVDEELHDYLVTITTNNASVVEKEVPANSFHQIFWQQQVEAASKNDSHGMCWHPLMIRFCLYLQHRYMCMYIAYCDVIIVCCVLYADLVEHTNPCVHLDVYDSPLNVH